MFILEIASGVVLGGIVLAALRAAVKYPAYSRARREQQMALVVAEHKRLWDQEYEKLILPTLRSAVQKYYFADHKKFWDYVNEKTTNPKTRAYYVHPKMRTPEERALVEGQPDPGLSLDAEAVRIAAETRGAASLAVIAGGANR